jgi:hypothetical protein
MSCKLTGNVVPVDSSDDGASLTLTLPPVSGMVLMPLAEHGR